MQLTANGARIEAVLNWLQMRRFALQTLQSNDPLRLTPHTIAVIRRGRDMEDASR